jgi:hypothetical protein
MKNIHVLPTDKPSKLIYNDANDLCYQSKKSAKNDRKWMYRKKFHIYITSNEEIKEGDWFLPLSGVGWKLSIPVKADANGGYHNEHCKKIILTTDQDLIDDGVQVIDDEFLEWFVKNPSCESVEINSEKIHIGWEPDYSFEDKGIEGSKKSYQTFYKIIIPKEEPKQETLEKAAEKYAESNQYDLEYYDEGGYQGIEVKSFAEKLVDFTTKWQAERMYSEEDMAQSFMACWIENVPYGIECKVSFNEWFKQFKKK